MYKTIFSIFLCNFIEWFDFILYGHMSYIFSKLFFANYTSEVAALLSLGIFAAAFIARPFGALIFGYIGDKFGRKKSLMISIRMMLCSTVSFMAMPTFDQIGISASVLLVLIRIIQGISFGGESGGLVLIAESAPKNKFALVCGLFPFSTVMGVVAGYISVHTFEHLLNHEQFISWGWRIPFAIGSIMTLIVLILRKNISESASFLSDEKHKNISTYNYFKELLVVYRKEFLLSCGLYALSASSFYIFTVFLSSSSQNGESISMIKYCLLMMLVALSTVISSYLAGLLESLKNTNEEPSNIQNKRIYRALFLTVIAILFTILSYPIYHYIICNKIWAYAIFAILIGFYIGPIHSVSVSLFPVHIRQIGFNLCYNIVGAIFGGPAPAISLWLIYKTNDLTSPAIYIMLCGIISLISGILILRKRIFYL